jgi:hypothetical protein
MMEKGMDEKRTLEISGEAEFKKSRLRRWKKKDGINQQYYHQTTKREKPMRKKRKEKRERKQTTR